MCIFCRATDDEIREYGKAFGYPSCCIEEFVKDNHIIQTEGRDVRTEYQKDIARSTSGFVPCKKHTSMIIRGYTTPEKLVGSTRNHKRASELNKMAAEEEDF